MTGWLIFAAIVLLLLGLGVLLGWLTRKRRREAMARLAARLGYGLCPNPKPDLHKRYGFVRLFSGRRGEKTRNLIQGERKGVQVRILDYDSPKQGDGRDAGHENGVVVLDLPGRDFPAFFLRREGLADRIAAAAGFEDIDFESEEFSKKYYVTCEDRRFAFGVITARQMEMLLAVDDINIEMGKFAMAFYLKRAVSPMELEWLHGTAWRFVENIPDFALDPKRGTKPDGRP